MTRLSRTILNALTILSLLLCLASAVLWARSYWREDVFRWCQPGGSGAEASFATLVLGRGGVAIAIGSASSKIVRNAWGDGGHWETLSPQPIRYAGNWKANRWGFHHEDVQIEGIAWREIIFPAWLATTLFALLPLTNLALVVRRRRRARDGHCRHCGYDLRATPERCPECGHAPSAAIASPDV